MEARKGKNLLLVEDEALTALHEKLSLERRGWTIALAASGEEAVEKAASDPGIDLILMDIDLGPGIDGTEAARRILGLRDLPVIFLSSHTEQEIVDKTEAISSYGYVVKNSGITVLEASIKMAFKLHEARRNELASQAALRETESRYRLLFEHMTTGFALHEIIVDERGRPVDYRFLDVNPAFELLTGLKKADLAGRRVLEALPMTEPHWIEAYGRVALTGEPHRFKNFSSALDRHFDVLAFCPERGRFAVIFSDVTDELKAQEALSESEARFRLYTESSPIGIFIADEAGRYHWANKAACSITGYSEAELLAGSIPELLAPESRTDGILHFRRLKEEGRSTGELRYRHGSGEIRSWQVDAVKLSEDRFIGFVQDITRRKKAEEDLAAQLEDKEILLREVHHRMKNDIASIGAYLTLRAGEGVSQEAREVLADAQARTESLALLYRKLQLSSDYSTISLKPYLEDLLSILARLFPDKGRIKLVSDIADLELESRLASSLGMAANELVTNSLKHAFEGRDSGLVSVRFRAEGGWLELRVDDDGLGLPQGFDASGASGLGMAILRAIAERLGGTLSLEGRPRGVAARLRFPERR